MILPSPPHDARLPGLPTALDAQAMTSLIGEALREQGLEVSVTACRPSYVRYKPDTSYLVSYELLLDEPRGRERRICSLRAFADDRAARIWNGNSLHRHSRRAARLHRQQVAGAAAHIPALGGLVQVVPLDRELPALAGASAPRRARRALAAHGHVREASLLRYRPGRKALLAYRLADDRELFGKIFGDNRAASVDRLARRLRRAGLPLPEPLGVVADFGLLLQAGAGGLPLAAFRGSSQHAAWLPALGQLLASFHAQPAHGTPGQARDTLALSMFRSASLLCQLHPGQATRLRRLARAIGRRLVATRLPPTLVHGDFYDDQALVGPRGAVLLDLDEARPGDPRDDLGTMLAHCSSDLPAAARDESRAAFVEGYARQPGTDARLAELSAFEAAGLLSRAVGPFRRLEVDWPSRTLALIELAEQRLGELSPTARPSPQLPVAEPAADDRIPALAAATDCSAMTVHLGRLLEREGWTGADPSGGWRVEAAQIVRHKPGRRALLRYSVAGRAGDRLTVFGKAFASRRAQRVHDKLVEMHSALGEVPGAPLLPHPLGVLPELRMAFAAEIDGQHVADRLRAGDQELAFAIGMAVRAFHASVARLPGRHSLDDELEVLTSSVRGIHDADPALGRAAAHQLDAVRQAAEAGDWRWRWRPVHRDLHPEQVLQTGGRVGLLDLDDAALSDPAVDVANFRAHLTLEAQRRPEDGAPLACASAAFLAAFEDEPELDRQLVELLEAATLLRLACIHRLRPDGSRVAAGCLRASRQALSTARLISAGRGG